MPHTFSKSHNGEQLDLSGIIPPMVTAFHPDTEELDEDRIRAEADFLISTGVHSICVGGSTGEGQGLSEEETFRLNKAVVDQAAGRVKVIGGVIADTTVEAIRKGEAARNAGVSSLQVTPPHYLWVPSVSGLVQHFTRVGDAVELPILIYNVIPWVDIDVHAMNSIIDDAPWVLGVKQSGGDMHKVADMMAALHDKVPITTGIDDLLYPTFVLGVDGAVTCMTAVFPRETIELFTAVQERDHDRALALHRRLLPVWRSLEGSCMTANAKYALSLLGRDNGISRSPILAPNTTRKAQIRDALQTAGFLEAVTAR
ncbi:dihydrodipicolinate synthase family protein [Rathayibacter soli]|uniref:dihydrodipicolinate synthase family protein n=1 Tax=Rathayibacter soli TaxID=3144168 RepID=UPI0027E4A46F|nr:dihydrodipicolinate synthase family protein [Glaciibacter superstes]